MAIRDDQWLGLAVRSETELPHEWIPVLTVIRNRIEARAFPNNAVDVILQAWQFSYFNTWRTLGAGERDRIYREAKEGYAGHMHEQTTEAARWVMAAPRWRLPFGHRVLNFWSPRSMDPRGSLPRGWRWSELRCFTLEGLGVDPNRFVFAEGVTASHPLAGNAWRFDSSTAAARARTT